MNKQMIIDRKSEIIDEALEANKSLSKHIEKLQKQNEELLEAAKKAQDILRMRGTHLEKLDKAVKKAEGDNNE